MTEWQSIETAPKDGTTIILLIGGFVIEGEWDSQTRTDGVAYGEGEWSVARLPSHGCGCCASEDGPATHWMPIPEVPND